MYRVALIVPTYNTPPELLRPALESMCRQTYPADVLVFDDHSSNKKTVQMAKNTIDRELRKNQKKGQDRNMAVLQSDSYQKRDYPTAGHVCNEGFAYAKAMGYQYAGMVGSDDVLLPDFCMKIVATFIKMDNPKLVAVSAGCYLQVDNYSQWRVPFVTPSGNITGSPPIFAMDKWDYKYPEDKKVGVDYEFPAYYREKGYDLLQITPMEYVYVFHKDQLSADIHYHLAADEMHDLLNFLKGKKWNEKVDRKMREHHAKI